MWAYLNKAVLCFEHCAMVYAELDVQLHTFLTSAVDEGYLQQLQR
jgi:hypothetical protein